MSTSLLDRLRKQADEIGEGGERSYGQSEGQSIEAFQSDFFMIEQYESQGLLDITREPHRESNSANRYVDNVRVKLTRRGVERWASKR
jgi:hypothetical protein